MTMPFSDFYEIQDVVNRCCHYGDYGDWDRLRDLHTDDCITELVGLDTRFVGVDQQITHAQHSYNFARGKNRHYNHNLIIDMTSNDEAVATYYIQQLIAHDTYGKTQIGSTAKMEDKLIRTNKGWKVAGRRFYGDQVFQLSEEELKDLA